MADYHERVIDEFRRNDGAVQGYGSALVLLHHVGARSGVARVSPVMSFRDGDDLVVVASKQGAPTHPGWYFNLLAQPDVEIEVAGSSAPVPVTATVLDGDDRRRVWDSIVAAVPTFADYQAKAGERRIPLVRLRAR